MATADPDDAHVVSPLTRLLLDRMNSRHWELKDVTKPPDGLRDGAPARSTMSHYLQPNVWLKQIPRRKAIAEIATAMRLDEDVIRDAAIRSLESNRGREPALSATRTLRDDEVRYQRPPGLSDEEWEARKRTAEATLRALFAEYEKPDV